MQNLDKILTVHLEPSAKIENWATCRIKMDRPEDAEGSASRDSFHMIGMAIASICYETGCDLEAALQYIMREAQRTHNYLSIQGAFPNKN